jgi:signal transduction histidine kinase
MKPKKFTIFRRIGILVFILITGLSLLFMGITYLSTTTYHEASTQLLNRDVAAHIAKFTSPFEGEKVNPQKADSVFYNAMVISPSAEVYFLDTGGKVLAYHAPKEDIKLWKLPLQNIRKLIASNGEAFVKNPDPKDPTNNKIFSAAEVRNSSSLIGYIYVILGSNKSVSGLLYTTYIGNLLIKAFCFILLFSLVISFVYLRRIQRNFNDMVGVLTRFEGGDLSARFTVKPQDELAPITTAFNTMADLLVYNINRLKATEQERKDFITTISHDLRTPLSIARGYSETILLQKGAPDAAEQKEFSQLVLQKIKQVENMVKQLFDLSKMEAADFVPQKEPFIFSDILQENINAYAPSFAEKNITMDCERCKDSSWVLADVGMMERVLQNLLVNAVRHTPVNGTIRIQAVKERGEVVLQVQSSGEQINAAIHQWINTKGGENDISAKPSGTGFGLLIIKKIIQLHGFSFQVDSSSAGGNTFTLRMPEHRFVQQAVSNA